MFFIVTLMHMIPDVPTNTRMQIEREKFISQKALWQVKVKKNAIPETILSNVFKKKNSYDDDSFSDSTSILSDEKETLLN